MGIAFAFIALICWGVGDFLIQRSARKFGDWAALFYITLAGAIITFPFVYKDLDAVFEPFNLSILLVSSLVILFAALFDFEALRVGKISVVEPIYALEVPITASLALFVLKEVPNPAQAIFIFTLISGIFLVSVRSFKHLRNIHLEKGVWLAVLATIGMGIANFLFGVGARTISPLMINWFTNLFMVVATSAYLFANKRLHEIIIEWRESRKLILAVSLIDNFAWIAYTYSVLYIPIAIAIGISESYIAMAAALGLLLNREKLKKHQWFGLAATVVSAIVLAFITAD